MSDLEVIGTLTWIWLADHFAGDVQVKATVCSTQTKLNEALRQIMARYIKDNILYQLGNYWSCVIVLNVNAVSCCQIQSEKTVKQCLSYKPQEEISHWII